MQFLILLPTTKKIGDFVFLKNKKNLPKGNYHCIIESKLFPGELNYSEFLLTGGKSEKEILLSSYICHPSLANNELSGPLVMLGIYEKLISLKNRRFNYRFFIGPETIGSLCFLHRMGENLKRNLSLGIVLTCLGGNKENLSVKMPRDQKHFINDFIKEQNDLEIREFSPLGGSDERQYCSPGFDLPVVNICRDIYGDYEGYHNSLDTKKFMKISSVQKSIDRIFNLIVEYEKIYPYKRKNPYGEPQLGKRDLYSNINSYATWNTSTDSLSDNRNLRNAILWILSSSDGKQSLFDIQQKSSLNLESLKNAAKILSDHDLIV